MFNGDNQFAENSVYLIRNAPKIRRPSLIIVDDFNRVPGYRANFHHRVSEPPARFRNSIAAILAGNRSDLLRMAAAMSAALPAEIGAWQIPSYGN